jgi:hypothetical protein
LLSAPVGLVGSGCYGPVALGLLGVQHASGQCAAGDLAAGGPVPDQCGWPRSRNFTTMGALARLFRRSYLPCSSDRRGVVPPPAGGQGPSRRSAARVNPLPPSDLWAVRPFRCASGRVRDRDDLLFSPPAALGGHRLLRFRSAFVGLWIGRYRRAAPWGNLGARPGPVDKRKRRPPAAAAMLAGWALTPLPRPRPRPCWSATA